MFNFNKLVVDISKKYLTQNKWQYLYEFIDILHLPETNKRNTLLYNLTICKFRKFKKKVNAISCVYKLYVLMFCVSGDVIITKIAAVSCLHEEEIAANLTMK